MKYISQLVQFFMCGRYALTIEEQQELEEFLNAIDKGIVASSNFNVAPTHQMPVALIDENGDRVLKKLHWGFMGWKPKEGQKPFSPINTRDDSLVSKPMWNRAFNSNRCIVPMNGFYEWTGSKGNKTPHYIYPKEGKFLAAAGIFSKLSPVEGLMSYSIITTSPNSLMENIHDRMPAFLHPSEFDDWLNPDKEEPVLLDMLQPFPDDSLSEHIVSKEVGNVKNNHPGLINPATLF
ncbi:MAG: SOS response-associated peptidase [Balneola sp.]